MSETDLAYVAGFFDGEGHCGTSYQMYKSRRSYHCNVCITNTDRQVLDWIQKALALGYVIKRTKSKEHWKDSFALTIPKLHVVKFLGFLLPYLKVKKKQAELMLQFFSADTSELKDTIHDALSALNKRGA